jgi:hypothetical protein
MIIRKLSENRQNLPEFSGNPECCRLCTDFEAKLAAKAAKKGALSYSRIRFPLSSTKESEAEPARPWNRFLRSE